MTLDQALRLLGFLTDTVASLQQQLDAQRTRNADLAALLTEEGRDDADAR